MEILTDRYRCRADHLAPVSLSLVSSSRFGFFRFGPEAVCFGSCAGLDPERDPGGFLPNAEPGVRINGSISLPFDPATVIESLRLERYAHILSGLADPASRSILRDIYYQMRPLLGVPLRRQMQRLYLRGWKRITFPKWPVDTSVETIHERLLALQMKAGNLNKLPFVWFWPKGSPSCTIVTHDVEDSRGLTFSHDLMDLNDRFGIKSSFQVVPEKRYPVPWSVLAHIRARGFEVNVHDLDHDGRLFSDHETFLQRAKRINQHGREFKSKGFRSAIMYRNADWLEALDFSYDMSFPNVAHLDPQRGGCCTVMPYFIGKILELPLTTIQDYSLFEILNDYSTRLWEQQIEIIRRKNGLMSFLVHPDYIIDKRPRSVYEQLLAMLADLRARGETWIALPSEVADWWRARSEMRLVESGSGWRIEGPESHRARLAFAVLHGDQLVYELAADERAVPYTLGA